MDKKERIDSLIKVLKRANYEYYVLDNPTLTDYQYDMYMKELEKLESETGYIRKDSPTQVVGSSLKSSYDD